MATETHTNTDTKKVKLRLLANTMRLYHFDEDGNIMKKRGFKRISQGQEFEVPEWRADILLEQNITTPHGFVRKVAVKSGSAEDPYSDNYNGPGAINEQASFAPEYDFGSTGPDGRLISDPENELLKQRVEARNAELNPPPKEARKSSSSSSSSSQTSSDNK